MGLFDGLFGAPQTTQKTTVPGYMELPGKRIGYGVADVVDSLVNYGPDSLRATNQRNRLLGQDATDAFDLMTARARQGSGLGMAPTQALQGVFQSGGMAAPAAELGNWLTSGGFENPAMRQAWAMAEGSDLGSNPYLDATFNQAARGLTEQYRNTISPGMTSRAALTGRLGSDAYARMRNQGEQGLATGLGDLATRIYGGAYEGDKQRQMQALGMQGGLAQQDIANRLQGASFLNTGLDRVLQSIGLTDTAIGAQYADANNLLKAAQGRTQASFAPFQYANAALAGTPAGQTTVGSTSTNPIISGLGLGAGIFNTFFKPTPV